MFISELLKITVQYTKYLCHNMVRTKWNASEASQIYYSDILETQ